MKNIHIPVFHESGWYDGDGIGSKLNYLAMARNPNAIQKLTIGPWGHEEIAKRWREGTDFGEAALIDLQNEYLRWFDHWLKGIDNGVMKEPLVNLFVMGSNRWARGEKYPLPRTQFEKLYLAGGGKLSFAAPDAKDAPDRYSYDPGDPTPYPLPSGRKDALVFMTAPFEKPYTIAGPVSAVLYASTSARDTDWFVHLVDVDADGKQTILWATGSGLVRARYRDSARKPKALEPGKIYKYKIDMWHTGMTIAAGHRLKVEVTSAMFPIYGRNLNTGENNETGTRFVTAEQEIYHDASRASYVLLPRIPEP